MDTKGQQKGRSSPKMGIEGAPASRRGVARADYQGGGREQQINSQMRVICCIMLLDVQQQYRLIEGHATKSVEDIKFHMCTEKGKRYMKLLFIDTVSKFFKALSKCLC